jgi:hypothetical protein
MNAYWEDLLSSEMTRDDVAGLVRVATIQNKQSGELAIGLVWDDPESREMKVLASMSPEMAAAMAGHLLRSANKIRENKHLNEIFVSVLNEKDNEEKS